MFVAKKSLSCTLLVRIPKDAESLEDGLVGSSKVKHPLNLRLRNFYSCGFTQEKCSKHMFLQRLMYKCL